MDNETAKRIDSQRGKFISLLQEAGEKGITNVVFKEVSLNHSARISELRKAGYVIEASDLGDGVFNYVLTYEPDRLNTQKRAIELFWEAISEYGDTISKDNIAEVLQRYRLNVVRNWGCNANKFKDA